MKIRLLFLSLLYLCFTQVQGQDNQCAEKASSVNSLVDARNFADAFTLWKSAKQCKLESLYLSGEKILTHQLSTKLSDPDREAQTAMLLQLYSDFDRDFPGNTNGNAIKKAMILYGQDKSNPEIFSLLDRSFTNDAAHFNDANALHIYFDLSNVRHSDNTISDAEFLEKTDAIVSRAESLFAQSGKSDYQMVAQSIGRISLAKLPCDKRELIYGQTFDANKNNADWLQKVTHGMSDSCGRSAIYYDAASQWYAIAPNPKAAFHLAQASVQQRKGSQANAYFAIAAQGETDPTRKAEILYTMATREIGNAPKSLELLRQSLQVKPDFGKAYLLMAEIYASTDCGKTELEKKARYSLAAQTALKAIQADKSLKKTAESRAGLYGKKAPTQDEIKAAKMSGKTIRFDCGINESVTLP